MPLPHDSILLTETSESPDDPFGFFPSENPKPDRLRTARRVYTLGRRVGVLTITLLVRFLAVIVAVLRRVVRFAATASASAVSLVRGWRRPLWRFPAWRFPAWRLPTWRLPAWQLPAWRDRAWRARVSWVISEARPVITHIATRTPLSAVTVTAFACGIVVGGSAVWLSGVSRRPASIVSTRSPQTPREVPRAAASPIAPVATAFAHPPAVQAATSRTLASAATPATRRPQFRGSLVVNSRPAGARVFVNGRSVGETPLVLRNQPAGSRAIRVALDGYEPWSAAVQVVADTETHLRAELRAQRPSAQP